MRRGSLASWAISLALAASAPAIAQTRVKTQVVRPTSPPAVTQQELDPPAVTGTVPAAKAPPAATPAPAASVPGIISDLSQLPAPVARTRERILAAARTGELIRLVAVMQSGETLPVFSLRSGQDPITYWRSNYPDSGGVEILAMLIDILETPSVHVDEGSPQEMYVWPYFARLPLDKLTAPQKVELLKIVTGSDYKDMLAAGNYTFFRVGIAPDGSWRFFVSGG